MSFSLHLFEKYRLCNTLLAHRLQPAKQDEEFSDNDNPDYYDEYDPIHNGIYQNGFLPADGDDNENVDIFHKPFENNNKNTNTSSSKSSSSNNSELINLLPHYQPRWHQQLNHSLSIRNPLNSACIKAHLESVNREIAQLNLRMESILLKQHQISGGQTATTSQSVDSQSTAIYRDPIDSMASSQTAGASVDTKTTEALSSPSFDKKTNKMPSNSTVSMNAMHQKCPHPFPNTSTAIESETEHIYETIPEDSESEPIYCSPYRCENSEQQLVEEWLSDHQKRTSSGKSPWSRTTKSVSSMEDHENSSSAYNTGGSCNSNHQLTLDLSDSGKDGNKTLTFCPTKHIPPRFGHAQTEHSSSNLANRPGGGNPTTKSSSANKKGKIASPTHNNHRQQESAGAATGKGNVIQTISNGFNFQEFIRKCKEYGMQRRGRENDGPRPRLRLRLTRTLARTPKH